MNLSRLGTPIAPMTRVHGSVDAATGPDLAQCHEEVRNGLHGLPDMFSRLPELEDLLV
jgi:hypothetical protein